MPGFGEVREQEAKNNTYGPGPFDASEALLNWFRNRAPKFSAQTTVNQPQQQRAVRRPTAPERPTQPSAGNFVPQQVGNPNRM